MKAEFPVNWILTRRSIRKYSDKIIPDDIINEILKAAMYAPSAANCQPWHFVVSSDKELFRKINAIHPYSSFLREASHAILVCGDEKLQHAEGYYLPDCGAATQNILLAAHTFGIGSCWIGIYPRKERVSSFKDLFRLPEHILPFALVSLGYPAEEKKFPDRWKPGRIHYNYWNGQKEQA